MPQESAINPSHYRKGMVECIDAIEASMTKEEFIGFLKGSILGYIWRAEDKHPDKPTEDLEKAEWYLNRWIQTVRPVETIQVPDVCPMETIKVVYLSKDEEPKWSELMNDEMSNMH